MRVHPACAGLKCHPGCLLSCHYPCGKGDLQIVATFDEIQENDFNLNIPHYVDTFEEEAGMNIAAVRTEIDKLEVELSTPNPRQRGTKTVQVEMDKYLNELGV